MVGINEIEFTACTPASQVSFGFNVKLFQSTKLSTQNDNPPGGESIHETIRIPSSVPRNSHYPPVSTVPEEVEALVSVTNVTFVTVGECESIVVDATVLAGPVEIGVYPAPTQ